LAIINSTADKLYGNASKITIVELHEPIAEPRTCMELLKGILIMKMAILMLSLSGIFIKYHYEYNPNVSVNDMVFVRAFA
jgi:hypothetical protein